MILTCPACDTKYVVKDDAIPPGGRQVRCASCKHSWHEEPALVLAEPADLADSEFAAPHAPEPAAADEPAGQAAEQAEADQGLAAAPQPDSGQTEESPWGAVSAEPIESAVPDAESAGVGDMSIGQPVAATGEWRPAEPVEEPAAASDGEEFVGYAPIVDDGGERRRWPAILGFLLLIAAAAAAFWFFAPPEWRERAGIAQAGTTPLQLMITSQQRRVLDSGNPIIEISGRVINPTDRAQPVPPIRAELRDTRTKQVVHQWTIDPPARMLEPGSSASFNSAELGIPEAGDQLTLTLGANQ
jgi:predicted Zn finger-like uncharacterized protein